MDSTDVSMGPFASCSLNGRQVLEAALFLKRLSAVELLLKSVPTGTHPLSQIPKNRQDNNMIYLIDHRMCFDV